MENKIIRDKNHNKLLPEQIIIHNQCVIYDMLIELLKAVDKAGLGFVYGGEVVEAQKKIKEYNDSIRFKKEKPRKKVEKDPNKLLIKPERHEDDSLTPL